MAALNQEHDEEYYEDKIANLQAELKSYGKDIVQLLNGIYGHQHPQTTATTNSSSKKVIQYDLKNNPFKMIEFLKTELIELLQQSHENQLLFQRHAADLEYCQQLTSILSNIGKIIEAMNKFDALLHSFQLIPAAEILMKIEADILDLPKQAQAQSPSSGNGKQAVNLLINGEIYKLLRNEKSLLKSRFKNTLRRILLESITIDFGVIRIQKKISDYLKCEEKVLEEPIYLKDIYAAMIISHNSDDLLQDLIEQIWKLVFVPLWKEKRIQSPLKISNVDYAEFLLSSVMRGLDQGEGRADSVILGSTKLPLPELFNHVGQFVDFLWIDVFVGNDEIGSAAALTLRSEPYDLLRALDDSISQYLPKNEVDIPNFKRGLEDCSRNLDIKLDNTVRKNAISLTTSSLSEHLNNLPAIFSTLRRKEILKTARDLVLLDYHNAMIGSGDVLEDNLSSAGDIGDPKAMMDQSGTIAIQKLKFDSCQISLAACRLLKFVHEVMKQSTTASPQIANLLFHSARDCLEIFIAVIPVKFDEIINTIPRMGAVFYNDCLYIAHNTILLTHTYRLELLNTTEEILQGNVGFIDFIPRLRKLGDQVMRNHLTQQQTILRQLVKRIGISPDRQAKKKLAVGSVAKSVGTGLIADRLKNKFLKHAKENDGVLVNENDGTSVSIDSFEEEECSNDENRASMLVDQLEKLSTQWLGVLQEVNYSRFMGSLIDDALKELMFPVLQTECITETAASEIYRVFKIVQRVKSLLPTEDASIEQQWKNVCPSWDKFLAITDLLEFNLNDIADGLSRKKFASFTGQEMIHLIKALFEDSPRRQSLLNSIAEIST